MKKVWVTRRKGAAGVYVEWYEENHRRRSKYFQPRFKKFVKAFMARKFVELNSDIRPIGSVIDVPWGSFVGQYERDKDIEGLKESSLTEIRRTLKTFHDLTKIQGTKQFTTVAVQQFIEHRRKEVKVESVNKDIRNLKALIKWGQNRHFVGKVEVKAMKAEQKQVRILNQDEIRRLLRAAQDDPQWHMRILLALSTGLRRSALDRLCVTDFDLSRRAISAKDKKTGKVLVYQPLPDAVIPCIEQFLSGQIAPGQVRFFKYHPSKKWYTILAAAKLRCEFHDLRRTFASIEADAGVPIGAVQKMLQHSDIKTTMKHYIHTGDPVMRDGVNKLGVKDWLA